jgi:hypothetical protein
LKLRFLRLEEGPELRSLGFKGPAIRRPLSLLKPQRALERAIRRDAEAMARRVSGLLREEGVLGRLDEDARRRSEKRSKGPTGRGGRPLGPDRRAVLEEVFDYDTLRFVGRLFSDEEAAFEVELASTLADQYEDLFELGGGAARRALGVRGSFNLRAPGISEALAERANQLAGNVSEDVFERLKTVLADQFYLKGKHPFDVAAVLQEEFSWLSRDRAELIARTESGAVTEEAQFITYEASGVPFKRWLTTLDGREREDHFDAHGQIRSIDEPFNVGGEELMYPLDPAGSAKQVCNCRCTQIPVLGQEQFLDESSVWDGDNDPDEFAKEKRVSFKLLRQPSLLGK